MIDDPQDNPYPAELELLLWAATAQMLKHEDPEIFLNWALEHLYEYYPAASPNNFGDPQDYARAATSLGRALWNAMPLPGNNFRPMPLPAPGRNNPCPCGSGKKYKHCCARIPVMTAFDSQILWFPLVDQLPQASLQDAIGKGRVPVEVLMDLSDQYSRKNHPQKAVYLLEPLFTGTIHKTGEAYDYALSLLCNYYDELGHTNKKSSLLQRILDTVKRSPLRSGAWQRLAAIRMDSGDYSGAWNAFREAQRDDPDSLSLGVLEVQLLMEEDRVDEAKVRAGFWDRRLHRAGLSNDEGPRKFLSAVARDPVKAMQDLGLMMAGDAVQHLDEWLHSVEGRAIPKYCATAESTFSGEDFAGSLQGMGVMEDELEPVTNMLQQQLELNIPDEQTGEEWQEDDSMDSLFLVPPPAISKLEADWLDVFPLGKPFSIHDEPFGDEDAWEWGCEEEWITFLDDHPEAFDSLEVIDDVVTALMQKELFDSVSLDGVLLKPLLLRAAGIMDLALSDNPSAQLVWAFAENRPALRSLARLISLYLRSGDNTTALQRAEQLLALNPHDNHGFRSIVVNQWLSEGKDAEVLALAENYPRDVLPDIPYGRVLALYRLNRLKDARKALAVAQKALPRVIHYLTAMKVRKPKLDPMGVTFGGDDQAWLYRDEMREVWLETAGAIDWLKQAAKQIN